jgi:serine-type D-Ala-D-Ala carboxypeptidase (penicillin-binding protein 5/6)
MFNIIPKSSIKIFIITFLIILLGTFLTDIGVKVKFNFLKPEKAVEKIQEPKNSIVKKLLGNNKNTFQLKNKTGFIESAYADTLYADPNSYIVVDFDTGEIVTEKNSKERYSFASITKVMTVVVALDLANPDEKFEISQAAADQIPTKIGIVAGEKMTLRELTYAALLTSANDATEVIKEGIDKKYGDGVFISAMNQKAKFIGLKNTSFSNPQGFDNNRHYSTSRDLAILMHYSMTHYPLVKETVEKDYEFLAQDLDHKQFDLQNWNGLLGVYPGVKGIKIGNTGAAGHTTSVFAERDGKKLIAILLGAPDIITRDLWTTEILDYSFRKSAGLPEINITEDDLYNKYATWMYW